MVLLVTTPPPQGGGDTVAKDAIKKEKVPVIPPFACAIARAGLGTQGPLLGGQCVRVGAFHLAEEGAGFQFRQRGVCTAQGRTKQKTEQGKKESAREMRME